MEIRIRPHINFDFHSKFMPMHEINNNLRIMSKKKIWEFLSMAQSDWARMFIHSSRKYDRIKSSLFWKWVITNDNPTSRQWVISQNPEPHHSIFSLYVATIGETDFTISYQLRRGRRGAIGKHRTLPWESGGRAVFPPLMVLQVGDGPGRGGGGGPAPKGAGGGRWWGMIVLLVAGGGGH